MHQNFERYFILLFYWHFIWLTFAFDETDERWLTKLTNLVVHKMIGSYTTSLVMIIYFFFTYNKSVISKLQKSKRVIPRHFKIRINSNNVWCDTFFPMWHSVTLTWTPPAPLPTLVCCDIFNFQKKTKLLQGAKQSKTENYSAERVKTVSRDTLVDKGYPHLCVI